MKFISSFFYVLFTNYMTRMGMMFGATDTILTMSKITNESLMVLENEIVFAEGVTRKYDDSFGVDGAKIGDTLNVRKPPRFIGTSGSNLNVEDYNQTSIPVIVGNPGLSGGTNNPYGDQFHVDVAFTTKDLKLSLGAFSDNVIKPAVAAIANKIDYIGLQMAKNETANIVGTYGTPASALSTYLLGGAYLTAEGTPLRGDRTMVLEQFSGAVIVDSLKGLFTPGQAIDKQFRTGLMGRDSAGMDWVTDQNVSTQTSGYWAAATAGTLTASTADTGILTSGWASTSTITLTNSATIALKKGDVISIAGLYPVNPQNRQVYGSKPRTFVVKADCGGTGSTTFSATVSPAIITAGQFQNCSIVTASTTATCTPYAIGFSSVGVSSPQNILHHKNAFTLAMADLPLPRGVEYAGRASSKEGGMSIRVVTQYTINNDQMPTRFDTLFGWAPLYGELSCRVAC
jgi:hypothetical protein